MTARADRISGTLRHTEAGKGTVRMEDVYDTDIDDLWSALTTAERLARWIAEVRGDLWLGGHIHARFTSGWEGPGRIDLCQAPRRLKVTLSPGTTDETVIDVTLGSAGGKVRLVIEESGIPLEELPAHGAGWQAHVEDLAAHIEGDSPGDWRARWGALTPTYQEQARELG